MIQERTTATESLHSVNFIKQLMRGVAHDLNNTLSPVIGYPEILADLFERDSPEYADLMEIRTLALRTVGIIKDLQWILRDESGSALELDLSRAVAGAIGGDAVSALRKSYPGVGIEWKPCESPLPVMATESGLGKAAECMLAIALTAADTPARVCLKTAEEGGLRVLEAELEGLKAENPRLETIGEPFHLKKTLGWGVSGLEWHIAQLLAARFGAELSIAEPAKRRLLIRFALPGT